MMSQKFLSFLVCLLIFFGLPEFSYLLGVRFPLFLKFAAQHRNCFLYHSLIGQTR